MRRTHLVPHPRGGRDPVPDPRPAAGLYLAAGVNAALAALASERFDAWELADDLKTALARTAACGDTCRVRPAADAVRTAANLLYAGATDLARPVLLRARTLLAEPPSAAQLHSQPMPSAPGRTSRAAR